MGYITIMVGRVIVYTWKIEDLLPVLSKKGESRLANVYNWKYLAVVTTWCKGNYK